MAGRLTQQPIEILALNANPNVFATQDAVEILAVNASGTAARLTQNVTEVLVTLSQPNAMLTQAALEALVTDSSHQVRLYHIVVEVLTNQIIVVSGSGRIGVTGLAFYSATQRRQEPDGKLTLTGLATVRGGLSTFQSSGRLFLFSGSSGTTNIYSFASSGSLLLNGIGTATVAYSFAPAGKLSFTGTSGTTNVFVSDPVGKLSLSGVASSTLGYVIQPVGPVRLSGLATVAQNSYEQLATGSLLFTGLFGVTVAMFVNPNGQLSLLGGGDYEYNAGFEGVGALLLTGLADAALTGNFYHEADGTLTLTGATKATLVPFFVKEFTWKVLQTQTITKDFTWSVGSRPLSWYRVTGKCKKPSCPPLELDDCNNNVSFVVNILARNISEVCRKLKERNFKYPIKKVEKFSNPPDLRIPEDDFVCNRLDDVTPGFTNLECIDLLVDFNATTGFMMDAVAILAFAHTMTGALKVSGGIPLTASRSIEPVGALTISGLATATQPTFRWLAGGPLTLTSVLDLTMSAWDYPAFGKLTATGLGGVFVEHDVWTSETVGRLNIGGTAAVGVTYGYLSNGAIHASGETLDTDFYVKPEYTMEANPRIRGSATLLLQHHFYEMTGGFGPTGMFRWSSSAITITPSGSLTIFGSLPFPASGIVGRLGGTATPVLGQQSPNGGRLRLGGEALVRVTVAEGTGAMFFGGRADVLCSDMGILNMGVIGVSDLVASQNVVFAFTPAPFAQPFSGRVLTTCCPDSVPAQFVLEQSFGSLNYLSKFLQRNSLSFPKRLILPYSSRLRSWSDTDTYTGFAPEYPGLERWHVTFIWDCYNDSLSTPSWRLNVQFLQEAVSTGKKRVSKMFFYFDNAQVCKRNKTFDFTFNFNWRTMTTKPTTIRPVAFEDEIGLFKSSGFLAKPTITLKITEVFDDKTQSTVDVGPPIHVASNRGKDLVEAISSLSGGDDSLPPSS